MKCPVCKESDLVATMTTVGVLVDYCPQCHGIWLDRGEIYFFTKQQAALRAQIDEALKSAKPSNRVNPHTNTALVELALCGGRLVIDYCPRTQGIWLDKGELERVPDSQGAKLNLAFAATKPMERKPKTAAVLIPNLIVASVTTLFLLYALLAGILITLVNFGFIEAGSALLVGAGIAVLQFLLSPFLMDFSLNHFYKIKWAGFEDLSPRLREFVARVCKNNNMKFPRMGIILDGSPNAFTYGHTPNNARIVVTQGLLDLLGEDEVEGVVAHEIGHAVHWDMLVMTVAYLVPVILYYIYRTLIRMRVRGRDKSAHIRISIAVVSYILYIVSEYIVLWFSRVREYFADRFGAEATGNPNSLAQALVKIGYGLAGRSQKQDKEDNRPRIESVKAMGIFDGQAARALAVASYRPGLGYEVDKENLKGAMRWDLWNPWATYYELHSTHPLIAKRIFALSQLSLAMGKEPFIVFDERRPESYWDDFLFDLFMSWLPLLCAAPFLVMTFVQGEYDIGMLKLALSGFGLGFLFTTLYSYPNKYFPEMNVSSLLKQVKVSKVMPVPCTIKGKIIGRGVPGLIWSEDFVMQDETGIMFLDYRQPLGIWNFLFGLLKSGAYINQEVKVIGWFRRAPVPYIEVKNIEAGAQRSACYSYAAQVVAAIAMIIGGIVWYFMR